MMCLSEAYEMELILSSLIYCILKLKLSGMKFKISVVSSLGHGMYVCIYIDLG